MPLSSGERNRFFNLTTACNEANAICNAKDYTQDRMLNGCSKW
jgi:hypothetical protein